MNERPNFHHSPFYILGIPYPVPVSPNNGTSIQSTVPTSVLILQSLLKHWYQAQRSLLWTQTVEASPTHDSIIVDFSTAFLTTLILDLSCLMLSTQWLALCLAHSRSSPNVCWQNEWKDRFSEKLQNQGPIIDQDKRTPWWVPDNNDWTDQEHKVLQLTFNKHGKADPMPRWLPGC